MCVRSLSPQTNLYFCDLINIRRWLSAAAGGCSAEYPQAFEAFFGAHKLHLHGVKVLCWFSAFF